jgi:hypothetical protein
MEYLNTPQTYNMLQQTGLSGDRGAAALQELQDLQRERGGFLNGLVRTGRVSIAQISQLNGGRNTPLIEALSAFSSDAERADFIRRFSRAHSRDEQQILREFVRSRDRIDPRLEQSRMLFGDQTA